MTDAGWTWEKALEIYKQLEDWDGPPVPWHGKGGPIKTSPPLYIDPLASYFLEACRVMGLPISDDFNAPNGRVRACVRWLVALICHIIHSPISLHTTD